MRPRSSVHLIALVLVLLLAACNGESTGQVDRADTTLLDGQVTAGDADATSDADADATSDADADGATDADTGADADTGSVSLLPCTGNDDCDSGYCVPSADGLVCTRTCEQACPPGWSCQLLQSSGGDPTFVCLDESVNLCRPCESHQDCRNGSGDPDARCVSFGEDQGSFCGVDCSDNDFCPVGTVCTEVTPPGGGGAPWKQCLPPDRVCACNAWAVHDGAHTTCGVGACRATRACTADGLEACAARTPSDEVCDGEDDDCDGLTDEGFLVGGFYVHPEHCGDCDTSCVDAFEHGSGTCGVGDGVPTCVVGACDPGFQKVLPTLCAPTGEGQCRPCDSAADCPSWLGCEPVGAGHFCLAACSDDAPCAAGFACARGDDGPDGVCELATGGCATTGTPCQAHEDCEDGNPCTTDACVTGHCAYVTASCDDGDVCTSDSCDPAVGCTHGDAPDDTPCDADSDGCTVGDACRAGACVAGAAAECGDAYACTEDVCVSTAAGDYRCEHPVAAASCLIGDTCYADGAANPVNPCQTCRAADARDGWSPVADGLACDADGRGCTEGDRCEAGACAAGATRDCADALGCTLDACVDGADGAASCSHTVAPGFCLIAGQCLADGAPNPESACERCDAARDATAWSPRDDGAGCDADGDGCTLGDACQDGACVAGAAPDCGDALGCTDDRCRSTGPTSYVCDHDQTATGCLIAGACWAEGALNPQNPCQTCQPAVAGSAWSAVDDGAGCDADGSACTVGDACQAGRCVPGAPADCSDGLLCTTDACVAGDGGGYTCTHATAAGSCLVGDVCFAAGDVDPANPCRSCDPPLDRAAFSARADGSPCDAEDGGCTQGDSCQGGVCQAGAEAGCDDGQPCTVDACVSTGPDTFDCTHVVDAESCSIGGACFARGQAAPDNPCLVCDPEVSATSWVAAPTGTACDADRDGCTAEDGCLEGSCVAGAPPDCADELDCTLDACVSTGSGSNTCTHTLAPGACVIAAQCWPAAAGNPENPCEVCDPARDTAAWSARPDTASCDADGDGCSVGDHCQAGACVAGAAPSCDDLVPCTEDTCVSTGPTSHECAHDVVGGACLIGAACFAAGDGNPANPCQQCEPTASTATWSPRPNDTACDADGDGCTVDDVCLGGLCQAGAPPSCPDIACTDETCVSDGPSAYHCENAARSGFCFIDGGCYDHGAVDPGNRCQLCNVIASQSAWSPRAEGTACDADGDGCTVGDSCRSGACRPGAAAGCADQLACTTDTCVSRSAFSFSCSHAPGEGAGCLIDGACRDAGGVAPDNPCLTCDPARSKTVWSPVADGASCDADGDGCTVGDACLAGSCRPGGTPTCSDGLGCTDDVCVSTGATSFDCSHLTGAGFCFIGGACFGPGAASPGDGCRVCDPAVDPTSFVTAPNGRPCDADGSGCTVGDSCFEGACMPGAQPSCGDGVDCTNDVCTSTGVESHACTHPLDGASCLIGGACWAAGTQNPANPCEVCDPALRTGSWSARENGTACDADGDGCTVGDSCQGGACRAGASPDCSDGVECTAGACVSTGPDAYVCDHELLAVACRVDEACWQAGEEAPGNPCLVCDPETSPTSWTPKLDDTPCDADGEGCTVGDSCQQGACEMGLPADCDDARGCTDDACVSNGATAYACTHDIVGGSCLVGGACYGDGAVNPDNPCERCDAAATATAWTARPDATACDADGTGCTVGDQCQAGLCVAGPPADCGDGLACTSDRCEAEGPDGYACAHDIAATSCVIDAACVAASGPRPGNTCQLCDPTRDDTGWSDVPNGTGCSDGDLCTSEDGCIDGQCVGSPNTQCTPGQVQTEGCGSCGTRSRTCLDTCLWGDWSGCSGQGECAAGATQSQSVGCGYCGSQGQTRTCSQTCSWGGWTNVGGCAGQGSCGVGQVTTREVGCGYCGSQTQQQTCTGSCQWPASWTNVGGCDGQGACGAGTHESRVVGCGNCGGQNQQRDCSGGCQWGGWYNVGGCQSQGVCAPGTYQTRAVGCGNCGVQNQRRDCSGSCGWGGWYNVGGCQSQGACSPGSTRQSSCEGCSHQVCQSNCSWGGCQLKGGNACNWNSGTNFRCCGTACSGNSNFCLSSCQWSSQCNKTCSSCVYACDCR
ncbi:MAG: hypothetical protein H6745_24395 [Deltaproteobacteria bacterium]|nr:hypothetical protein [Deltaproteobacteria bacterium]